MTSSFDRSYNKGQIVWTEMVKTKTIHLKDFENDINDRLDKVPIAPVKDSAGNECYPKDIRIASRDEEEYQCTITYRADNDHPTKHITTVKNSPKLKDFNKDMNDALSNPPKGLEALDVRIAPWFDDGTIGVITWHQSAKEK